jgi:hypothetical protein
LAKRTFNEKRLSFIAKQSFQGDHSITHEKDGDQPAGKRVLANGTGKNKNTYCA